LIFGSLLNKNGSQFDAQTSDIDIVVVLRSPAGDTAMGRYAAWRKLELRVPELELALFRALKRLSVSKPIASIFASTEWEIERCIHKDRIPTLLSAKQFKPVEDVTGDFIPLAKGVDHDFLSRNNAVVDVLAFSQGIRNKHLLHNAHGTVHFDPVRDVPITGDDPLPKAIMRQAARLGGIEAPIEQRSVAGADTDVAEGLEFISNLLYRRRGESAEIGELREWLAVARQARGTPSPFTRDHCLLLVELLADAARGLVVDSVSQSIANDLSRFETNR
jgi:hypothetical protein